jgi:TolB protein
MTSSDNVLHTAVGLLLGVLIASAGCSGSKDPTPTPGAQAKIAFVREDPRFEGDTAQNGDLIGDIYVMNPDGTERRRLTRNFDSVDEYPAWSPDGQRIVFTSNRADTFDLWVMNADGSSPKKLRGTKDVNYDLEPAWSPDGSKIVFVGHRFYGGNFATNAILVMNADGTGERKLALTRKSGYASSSSYSPTWSPDGARIAFSRLLGVGSNGDSDIWIMKADGRNQRHLQRTCCYAAWSPDGRRIAYMRGGDLYLISPDGRGRRRLTRTAAFEVDPTWSPDGRKIAFASDARGNFDIWIMKADGTHRLRLTRDSADEGQPAWSPNGAGVTGR